MTPGILNRTNILLSTCWSQQQNPKTKMWTWLTDNDVVWIINKNRCGFSHLFLVSSAFTYSCAAGCLNTVRDTTSWGKCGLRCNITSFLKIFSSVYRSVIDPSTAAPPRTPITHREVSFGREPLGEVVKGIWLGADWVAVAMDLVEQVSWLVQAVITDVHILLFYILWPPCMKEDTLYQLWSTSLSSISRAYVCVFILLCFWLTRVWCQNWAAGLKARKMSVPEMCLGIRSTVSFYSVLSV